MKRVPEEAPISDSATPLRGSNSPNTSLGVEIGSVESSFSNNIHNQIGGASLSSTLDHAEILGTSTTSRNEFGGGRFQSSYSRPGYSYTQGSAKQYSTNTTTTASYDPCEHVSGTSLSVQHPSESHRSSYYDENLPPTPANVREGEKRFIQRTSQSQRASHSRSLNSSMQNLPPTPQVPSQSIAEHFLLYSKTSGQFSWLQCFQQFMTIGRRMGMSLLLATFDWVSDITVMLVWFTQGHFLWSTLLLTIFVIAGVVQVSALYLHQKVRGARLILNFLGLGAFMEALMFLWLSYYDEETRRMRERRVKIRLTKSLSQKERRPILRFIVIRAIQTLFETLPAGALQLYVAVLSPSNFHTINVVSILSSIIGLGYGIASSLVDYPDNEIISVSRRPKVFICIFLLVMGDFLWRCVPVALFFATHDFISGFTCALVLYLGHFATSYFSRVADPFGPDPFTFFKLLKSIAWSVPLCFNVTFSLYLVLFWGGHDLCKLRNEMLSYNCGWVFLCNLVVIVLVCVENTSKTVFTWLTIAISGMAISFSGLYIVYREGEQIRKHWQTQGGISEDYELSDVDLKQNDLFCSCW